MKHIFVPALFSDTHWVHIHRAIFEHCNLWKNLMLQVPLAYCFKFYYYYCGWISFSFITYINQQNRINTSDESVYAEYYA